MTRLFPDAPIEALLAPFDHTITKSKDGSWTVTVRHPTVTVSARDENLRAAAQRAIKTPRGKA